MSQLDPWNTGTPGYRAALVAGMGSTLVGIIVIVAAALAGSETTATTLRTLGLILIGVGLVSHVVGIGLRKRQAAQIIRHRKSTG